MYVYIYIDAYTHMYVGYFLRVNSPWVHHLLF